jgi:ABC-type branched-subunit amino acid transport system substrate-binding protein
MKKSIFLFTLLALIISIGTKAQNDKPFKYKVGLFVPLYLDSAFDELQQYLYGKGFPRQSVPGLEFYEGAEFALDSLNRENVNLEMHVFDIRSAGGNISKVITSPLMDSLDLIIGQVSGNDYLQLAGIAKEKNIPFISATYPNDGGVKSNPQVVMVNAKINTHIQSIYNYILRNWGTGNIVWFRRKNTADDRIEDVFKQLNQSPGGGVMKYKQVFLPDNFTLADISQKLDSTRQNVIIAGSLDENFAKTLLNNCVGLSKSYKTQIVGMPTWEGIKDLSRSEYRPLSIVYSTTFYNAATTGWSAVFEESYRKKTFSKPSDMAFKGFEITYYFVHLLLKYDTALISNLNDKSLKLITDYDFKPIRWSKSGEVPDYFENKRIYILRRLNGVESLLN